MMQLASISFEPGQTVPSQYTCEGANISPELHWSDAPENTQTFALITDDPDAPAGTWVHWVMYNIPADTGALPENLPKSETLENGIHQGRNDFPATGYGGPCPPRGHGPHRYFFKLYALDTVLELKKGVTKAELERAMQGHILAKAELMGLYERQ
ncbi:YbhB/YbcL family Raf kinase inhibitor-like protein [Emcibacter nanhaiensis]|nr:YbhB/YbcL family Raf kinase inhibitor-like protein [Emcibacter nanhaiensis]